MKLWDQSLARQTESTPYGALLRKLIDGACDPGTTKMGELAVKLKRKTGRFTSKRLTSSAPAGDFLNRIREHYGPDVYPAPKS